MSLDLSIANTQRRYLLLPPKGLRSALLHHDCLLSRELQRAISAHLGELDVVCALLPHLRNSLLAEPFRVLDSAREDGVKLLEGSELGLLALKALMPGFRLLPLVHYRVAGLSDWLDALWKPFRNTSPIRIRVVCGASGKPLAGVHIAACTSFARDEGQVKLTDAKGEAVFEGVRGLLKVEQLYLTPPGGFWSWCAMNTTFKHGLTFSLKPVTPDRSDFLQRTYGALPADAGRGVRVGVLDTGVDAAHPDLRIKGGAVFVSAERDAGTFTASPLTGGAHGTHVAGIIAGQATAGGRRGVAPGAEVYGYRVFGNKDLRSSNFDLVRAIDRAVDDGCDLINMSLGGNEADEAVQHSMADALDRGSLCLVSAGNARRQPVYYPAAWSEAVAVSALGMRGCYAADSVGQFNEATPQSPLRSSIYLAAFSNIGPAVDVAAPGVGIVSTLPGGGYGDMSGTSMACPAATGYTAALLSRDAALLNKPRDRARSDAIRGRLYASAKPLGFSREQEGAGLPCDALPG